MVPLVTTQLRAERNTVNERFNSQLKLRINNKPVADGRKTSLLGKVIYQRFPTLKKEIMLNSEVASRRNPYIRTGFAEAEETGRAVLSWEGREGK